MRRVLAVIAEVVNDHVVAIEQPSPERKVAVDRKRVAVAQHQARSAGDPMTAHPDNRAIVHDRLEHGMRLWDRHVCRFRHRGFYFSNFAWHLFAGTL